MKIRSDSFHTWLNSHGKLQGHGYTIADLNRKDAEHRELERDIRFVLEQFDTKRYEENQIFCIDFDVIYSGSEWNEGALSNNFWSALLIYLDAGNYSILPGTLYEINKYFKNNSHLLGHNVSDIGLKILEAFEEKSIHSTDFAKTSDQAGKNFKKYKFVQKALYIYETLRKSASVYSAEEIGVTDKDDYLKCAQFLGHQKFRTGTVLNNRVDAFNYLMVRRINSQRSTTDPESIFVTNSKSLMDLENMFHLETRSDELMTKDRIIWNVRAATIYRLIKYVTKHPIEAYELAWNLYNDQLAAKKAIQIEIDRVNNGGISNPSINSFGSEFSKLIQNIHGFDELIDKDFRQITGSRIQERILIDHHDFKRKFEKTINELKVKTSFHYFENLMIDDYRSVGVEEIEFDQRFSCNAVCELRVGHNNSIGRALIYDEYVQLILRSNNSVARFADIIDTLRDVARTRMISGDLDAVDLETDPATLKFIVKGVPIALPETDLRGLRFGSLLEEDGLISLGDVLDSSSKDETSVYSQVVKIFSRLIQDKVNFVRINDRFYDISMEADFAILSISNPRLFDQFDFFAQRVSSLVDAGLGAKLKQKWSESVSSGGRTSA